MADFVPDNNPPVNGLPPPEENTPQLTKEGAVLDAVLREADDLATFLPYLTDPVLGPLVQEHLLPLFDPLRRTLPHFDIDEADEQYPYGDAYNARALIQRHRHEIRFCEPWNAWLTWGGTHWQRDTTGLLMRWQRQVVADLLAEADQLEAAGDDMPAKMIRRHVERSLQTRSLEAAIKQARSWQGMSLDADVLDAHPWSLNCANGTLDLRTGMLRPHHPDDLLTKCLPTPYDPQATCPTWEQFLWRITGGSQGDDDPDTMGAGEVENRREADQRAQTLIDFHQRFIGYTLTGATSEQCFCILHGGGANGKSTYLETVRALLGEYGFAIPSASLLSKERQDAIPNDIARLRGARLVTAVEIGEGKRLDEELLKRLTGQDTITARFLRQEFFEFQPQFKLMVACNHLPNIRGTDRAIWRRIHRVPFAVTIPEEEQDKALAAKLHAELPGILAWAVRGCLAWQAHGLGVPEAITQATAEYRTDQDALGRFLEECCLQLADARVKAGDLYDAYKAWCSETGEYAITLTALGKRLDERGFAKHVSNYVWRLGLALKDSRA